MSAKAHDPGGKRSMPLQGDVTADAEFSECGRYRYWLSRFWVSSGPLFGCRRPPSGRIEDLEADLRSVRAIAWLAMNPSQADLTVDDPTVRREIGFSRAWGYEGLVKFNVLPYRASYPSDIPCDPQEARPARNLEVIRRLAPCFDRLVLACGDLPKPHRYAFDETLDAIAGLGPELVYFSKTQRGFPVHPLYQKKTATLQLW